MIRPYFCFRKCGHAALAHCEISLSSVERRRTGSYLVCTVCVDFVDEIPVLILHVLEADIPQDTGVVDEDIHSAEVLNGCVDNRIAVLDAVVVCYSLAASSSDFVDNHIGSLPQNAGQHWGHTEK